MARPGSLTIVLAALALAACNGQPAPESPSPASMAPPAGRGEVEARTWAEDSTFVEAVLADGVVTREELEQAYARFEECLVGNGAAGEIWVAPEYGQTSPALNLYADDEYGERVQGILDSCQDATLGAVERSFALANPVTPAQEAQMLDLALRCLRDRSPELADQVPVDADYGAVRIWAVDFQSDPAHAQAIDECVVRLGIPFRSFGT